MDNRSHFRSLDELIRGLDRERALLKEMFAKRKTYSFRYDIARELLPRLESLLELSVIKKKPVFVSILREEMVSNYPYQAIRELLLNACMHRDMQSNTPLRFYEFASHLEILNAGGLYGNARPENFPGVNDYRNPLVACAMKTLGYVNMFNRGVGQVQTDLQENGNLPAEFNVNLITAFKVDVKVSQSYTNENGGKIGGKDGGDVVENIAENVVENILASISKNSHIHKFTFTLREMVNRLPPSSFETVDGYLPKFQIWCFFDTLKNFFFGDSALFCCQMDTSAFIPSHLFRIHIHETIHRPCKNLIWHV